MTQADGRYTLLDHRFTRGPIQVSAAAPDGATARATASPIDRADTKMAGRAWRGSAGDDVIEFRYDVNGPPLPPASQQGRRYGVMDSRFKVTTAQLLAGWSFGLVHATMND